MSGFGLQDLGSQLDGVVGNLRKASTRVRRGMNKGLMETAEKVFAKSQAIVPVGGPPTSPRDPHPGALKESGVMVMDETDERGAVITISYGQSGTIPEDYAWRQHQDLTYRHKPGQTAKYVERPIMEEITKVSSRVIGGMREELGAG